MVLSKLTENVFWWLKSEINIIENKYEFAYLHN